jgi:hypothetical protein|tara:strand:+ start:615 stop:1100 length:486 start_codon:yes stop_codon:yes gene_type:complete
MKVRNAIKKVKSHFKKQGIDIQISSPEEGGDYKWRFQHENYVGSFSVNGMRGHEPEALDGDACLFHVRRYDDHSDSMTDYFAGYFRDNVTQLCESLLPSPSKYKAGVLVRGKSNKRAQRWGFAGKIGLVVNSGNGQAKVLWHGTQKESSYLSERDLELVSG